MYYGGSNLNINKCRLITELLYYRIWIRDVFWLSPPGTKPQAHVFWLRPHGTKKKGGAGIR